MPKWSTRDLLLAGSLAVNLVLAGFVLGAGVRLAGPGAAPPPPIVYDRDLNPRALFGSLSPEARRAVRQAFAGEGARSAPLFRELREARGEFETAARTEPFDAERARAALSHVRDVERELQSRSSDLMVEILGALSAEERARVLEEIGEARRRFRDTRRFPGPGGDLGDRPPPPRPPDETP